MRWRWEWKRRDGPALQIDTFNKKSTVLSKSARKPSCRGTATSGIDGHAGNGERKRNYYLFPRHTPLANWIASSSVPRQRDERWNSCKSTNFFSNHSAPSGKLPASHLNLFWLRFATAISSSDARSLFSWSTLSSGSIALALLWKFDWKASP